MAEEDDKREVAAPVENNLHEGENGQAPEEAGAEHVGSGTVSRDETSVDPSLEPSRLGSLDEDAQVVRAEMVHVQPATITTSPSRPTSDSSLPSLPPLPANTHAPDSPTTELITTLRSQIALLTDAASQLNTKLVGAVSRVGDLEDALDQSTRARTEQESHVATLEAQKAQWEESMNTGLLVERGAIKEEMQRLVDGLVEEERRRGSAEEGRQRVEREVDDLSASLFEQANTMVAAERLQRVQAESRLKAAEDNLSNAEAAVREMQQQLQSLPSLLLPAAEMSSGTVIRRRHLAGTLPHNEFRAFVHHLRMSKPQHAANLPMLPPPLVSALLAQPFLARTVAEDHDPTLRLDAAPDLSWLSRRSANTAVLSGELAIEPVSAAALLGSAQYAGVAEIACSMCGRPVFGHAHARLGGTVTTAALPAPSPGSAKSGGLSPGAGTGRFSLKPFFNSPTASTTPRASPGGASSNSPMASPSGLGGSIPPVYVFRIGSASSTASSSAEKDTRMYPLCASGWCLGRLRATCELWRFVRSGMIDVIWRGEDGWVPPAPSVPAQRKSMPALPPRKRSGSKIVKASPEPGSDADTESKAKRSCDTSALGLLSAPPLTERPELPVRKRSGWGLGFKFGSRNSSGDLPKGESSASEKEQEQEAAVAEEVDGAVDEKMEVEVRDVTDRGVETVAEGQAVASSEELAQAAKDSLENGEAAKSGEDDGPHLDTPTEQQDLTASPAISASDVEQGFSTPKGDSPTPGVTDLPPVAADGAEEGQGQSPEAPATVGEASDGGAPPHTVDLTSPRLSSDMDAKPDVSEPGSGPIPADPADARPAPPPIPRRAPNRASVDLSNGVQPVSDAQVPAIETISESETSAAAAEPNATNADAPHTPQPDGAAGSEMITPKAAMATSEGVASYAPALPPRNHARNSSSVAAGVQSKYIEGDDWEAKTWREIIRLKEEMWMARLGVVAGDD